MNWREHSFSKIIERIPIGVAITRPDGTLEYTNTHLSRLIGARARDLVGLPLSRYVNPVDAPPCGEPMNASDPAQDQNWCREVRICGGAETFDILDSVYPLHDAAGAVTHYIHLMQDISAQKRLDFLSMLAFYDSLTKLPNRNLFRDRLERAAAAAKRKRGAFAVLYIDIDHFKKINDTLGHEAGDELLRQVAARLTRSLRISDSVARWGGDEFVALLDGLRSRRVAARIADKLLAACSGPYSLSGGSHCITLSIGISFYPRNGRDVATLLRHADQAMYAVKGRGRNGYHVLEEPDRRYLNAADKTPRNTVCRT